MERRRLRRPAGKAQGCARNAQALAFHIGGVEHEQRQRGVQRPEQASQPRRRLGCRSVPVSAPARVSAVMAPEIPMRPRSIMRKPRGWAGRPAVESGIAAVRPGSIPPAQRLQPGQANHHGALCRARPPQAARQPEDQEDKQRERQAKQPPPAATRPKYRPGHRPGLPRTYLSPNSCAIYHLRPLL